MSKTFRQVISSGLIAGLMMTGGVAVAADWGGGHGMAEKKEEKAWGGGSMMGFEEGHMTARLRAVWRLNLDKGQRREIREIQKDLRGKHWELSDKVDVLSDDLMWAYRAKQRDAKKIGKIYGKIFDLRRQQIELAIEAGNKVADVLTSKQKKQWQKYLPRHGMSGEWGK